MTMDNIMILGAEHMRRLHDQDEDSNLVVAAIQLELVKHLKEHVNVITDATTQEKRKRRYETCSLEFFAFPRPMESLARELVSRLIETQLYFKLKPEQLETPILDLCVGARDWPKDKSGAVYISLLV
jgi:hypothetical protein